MKQARRATTVGEEVLGAGGPAVGAGSGSSDSCGLSGPAVELSAVELADLFVAETAALQGAGPAGDPASAECAHLWAEVEAALAGQDQDPAQVLHHSLSGAEANLGQVTDLGPAELVGVFDPGVVAGLEAVGRARSQCDGALVTLAVEAHTRGLQLAVGLTLAEWLRVHCPWLSGPDSRQVQDIVRAGQVRWGTQLVIDAAAGVTPVRRAYRVARTMFRLASSLDVDQQETFAGIMTRAAADPNMSDLDLEVVCKKLLIDLLNEKPREQRKKAAQELRCASRRPLASGLTRFTIDAPDGDAALLEGVLGGPLAAPAPAEDGTMDPRSGGQRGYDALLMVLNRGLSNPDAPPSSGRASVMITIPADPKTGKPVGAGVTALGRVLDPEQIGRFACIGDVTPIALGDFGEPLSLGRTVRLATPGQFKTLLVRDVQCTYPGCSVPGTYCDSHHLIWWCRGGGTDIAFLVLLCPRHHTTVHDKDLMATVTGNTVTWHL